MSDKVFVRKELLDSCGVRMPSWEVHGEVMCFISSVNPDNGSRSIEANLNFTGGVFLSSSEARAMADALVRAAHLADTLSEEESDPFVIGWSETGKTSQKEESKMCATCLYMTQPPDKTVCNNLKSRYVGKVIEMRGKCEHWEKRPNLK